VPTYATSNIIVVVQRFGLWLFQHRWAVPIPFILTVAIFNAPTYPYKSMFDVLSDLLGLAVIASGLVLRAWAVGYAGSHTRSYRLRSPRLIMTGPYAYVRNPIYLGNFVIGLGVVIMTESWVAFIVFLGVFGVEYGAIVRVEEHFLAAAFGDRYEEYRNRIPRWLPRLSPAPTAEPAAFSWRPLRKERSAVLSAVAMATAIELGEFLHRLLGF
jgi:protein-S-isoprenylcysteine O-methyltransferase Ste14